MNKKVLGLCVLMTVATTAAWAAPQSKGAMNGEIAAMAAAKALVQPTLLAEQNEKVSLDVESAVQEALAGNNDLLQAKAAYKTAVAQVSVAQSGKLPKLQYQFNGGRKGDDVPRVGPRGVEKGSIGNAFSNTFTISLPLYTGGAVEGATEAAEYGREASWAAVKQMEQQVKFKATKGYYTVIQAKNKRDIAKQAVRDYEAHLKMVQAQYNVGLVAKSDVLATKTALASARTNLIQAENAVVLSESVLMNVLGKPVTATVVTKDGDLNYMPYGVSLAEARTYALTHRPELVQATMAIKASEANVDKAEAGHRPTVGVAASKGWNGTDPIGTEYSNWSVGASVSWSLWDGGATKHSVTMAKSQVDKAKEGAQAAINGVQLEVRQAYLDMKAAEQTIESTKVATKQAQENFRIASLRYQAGVGTNLDVLDAETSLDKAKNAYVDALYNYNIAVASLEKAMGIDASVAVGKGASVVLQTVTQATL